MTFGILGFFQKTNEQIRFFCLTVLKTNLFVCFLEESEDTKKSFRNYLTFTEWGSRGLSAAQLNLEASCKLYQQFLMTWQKEHFCSFVRRYSGIRPVFTRERGVFYWYCYRASYSRIVRSCSILSPEKGKKLWWITCTLVTLHQNIDWPEKWPSKRVL